jgi:hypothetical protein
VCGCQVYVCGLCVSNFKCQISCSTKCFVWLLCLLEFYCIHFLEVYYTIWFWNLLLLVLEVWCFSSSMFSVWLMCFLEVKLYVSCSNMGCLYSNLWVVWRMWFEDQMEDGWKKSFLKPRITWQNFFNLIHYSVMIFKKKFSCWTRSSLFNSKISKNINDPPSI